MDYVPLLFPVNLEWQTPQLTKLQHQNCCTAYSKATNQMTKYVVCPCPFEIILNMLNTTDEKMSPFYDVTKLWFRFSEKLVKKSWTGLK